MAEQFAIITFRNTGPIKTWSDMRAANVHNARTKPLAHAMVGAAPPEHLIGTGDLIADVKWHLRSAKLDPGRLRRNGVIAYEAILSASAEYFDAGTADERAGRLTAWKAAQQAWALKRYGVHRVASMVLHTDEKVPHIHLVVIPFEVVADGRRKDQKPRWSLVGRTISGPGKFDEVQDDYAATMARFGLVRGIRGSGRKHEPVPVYLERMALKERAVDADRADVLHERALATEERARAETLQRDVERREREVATRAAQLDRDDTARRRQLQRERDALMITVEGDRLRLRQWDGEMVQAEKNLAAGVADLTSRQETFARFRDELIATREKLVPIVAAATAFVRAAQGMRPEDIGQADRPAVHTARQVLNACNASQVAVNHQQLGAFQVQ